MLQHPQISAFRSSLASGLDNFGYFRGLRQGDYHRANRLLDEWAPNLFDASGMPVVGRRLLRRLQSNDAAAAISSSDDESPPAQDLAGDDAGVAGDDVSASRGLGVQDEGDAGDKVPEIPKDWHDELQEQSLEADPGEHIIVLDSDVDPVMVAQSDAYMTEFPDPEELATEEQQEQSPELVAESDGAGDEADGWVTEEEWGTGEQQDAGIPPGLGVSESPAVAPPPGLGVSESPAVAAFPPGRGVSESPAVAEFPPLAPSLPLPAQPVVQNFYMVWAQTPPPHPTPPSYPPLWHAPMMSQTASRRSRTPPRQSISGWCKQCKKPKSVCYKLGDWECPTCGVHNYASKDRCTNQKCPSKAERWCKSCRTFRVLCLKDGDWICEMCQNHNFAWREVVLAVRYSGFEIAAIVLSGSAGKVRARVERSYGWAHHTSMVQ